MSVSNMPNDPMMLLSFVNTRMRDEGISLEELCAQFQTEKAVVEEKLDKMGYSYNNELKKFV